ncbi:universal stress protein [Thermodesulfovibrionales bacterium]|nr:universal stress protein [Thermodesulfovibrionales bacterium]MCL0075185.1 universal stress protein [Thermodesulfovibrionales bacterium]
MYKKIMTPLDGSEFAECALPHVRAISIGDKTPEIVLLMVLEENRHQITYLSGDERRNLHQKSEVRAKDYLAKIAGKLKSDTVTVQTVVSWGRPADEILKCISDHGVDMVIMSTRGLTGVSRWAFGSVAEKVMRRSPAPTLIISPVAPKFKIEHEE